MHMCVNVTAGCGSYARGAVNEIMGGGATCSLDTTRLSSRSHLLPRRSLFIVPVVCFSIFLRKSNIISGLELHSYAGVEPEPICNVLERIFFCDVEDKQNAHCISVVSGGNRPESLLT